MSSEERTTRYEYVDVLRIIACLLVIFNHTNDRGFFRYIYDETGTFCWITDTLVSMICKVAVPIFFMITGGLLLKRTESIKKTYSRIIRILLDIIIFTMAYYAVDVFLSGEKFELSYCVGLMVQSNYWHLWYLYSYIGFLLVLPFLREFLSNLKRDSYILIYVIAVIVLGFLPIIEYFFVGLNSYLKISISWFTADVIIYPILGYYLSDEHNLEWWNKKKISVIWLINIVCFCVGIIAEYLFLFDNPGNKEEKFLRVFNIINAPVIYITVRWVCSKIKFNCTTKFIINEVGKCTFGVYLFHLLFLWKIPRLYDFWINVIESGKCGSRVGIYFTCVGVFGVSCVVVYLIRRVPIIKKLM